MVFIKDVVEERGELIMTEFLRDAGESKSLKDIFEEFYKSSKIVY
jgi:hypothetical protein